MSALHDLDARRVAATCFDRNVVVTAGAGSGKTTLLVERLLNLVLGRGVPLGSIVALTFTEKAAAEMRGRLAAQLSRVLAIVDSGERGTDPASFSLDWVLAPASEGGLGVARVVVRDRALAALHELDGATIGTIHSFCAELLRRHPAASRLDPGFRVDEGAIGKRVLDDEWIAYQARTLQEDAPEARAWREILDRHDPGIVRDVASRLLDMADVPELASDAVVAAVLERARGLLARCEEAEGLADGPNATGWCAMLAARLRAYLSGGVAELKRHAEEAGEFPTEEVPKAGRKCTDPERVRAAMDEARRFTDALLRVDDATCAAVLGLARELAAGARARLDVEGAVSFSELLARARDILLRDAAVRRQAQSSIEALLLDEFQDTDPLQYEIAFLLAEDPARPVSPGGDPWSARLLPGRLFVVGDPKQSIYRFRGADMAACERATATLLAQGARALSLTSNFRSHAAILGPINDLCEALILEDLPYQPRYERLHASRASDATPSALPRVELWSVRGFSGNAEERRRAEGRAIGSQVRAWRESGVIRDYGSVVMLLRVMVDGEAYQRGLAELGVPFVTQGGKGFFSREEIVQAIALLRCLAWPHDAASILAVLRSPSCGASDAEILRLARLTGGSWTLRSAMRLRADERAQAPLACRALEGMRALAQRVALLPADEAVRFALSEPSPGPGADGWHPALLPLHAASRSGAQRIANLEKLVERAESLARDEGLSLSGVVERLSEELATGAKQGESPLADEAVDAVRIMSIHQAKGLEFGTVIVPDVARQPGSGGGGGVEITARDGVLGMRLPDGSTSLGWHRLDEEDRRHDAAEARRTLYVALTRAKDRLVVVNGDARPKSNCQPIRDIMSGWRHDPTRDDGGADLHGGVAHRVVVAPDAPSDPGEPPARAEDLARAVLAGDEASRVLAAARRGRARSASGVKEEREAAAGAAAYARADAGIGAQSESAREAPAAPERDEAAAGSRPERSLARAVGVAVHLALEQGAIDQAEGLDALVSRAAALAAAEVGVPAQDVARAAADVVRGLASSEIAAALRGARVVARELPFLLPTHEGSDWQGFIDLVVERDGETWVVDWKTDRVVEPERHGSQLALYAEAVRRWRALGKPPRQALAYVALGKWVEL